jgi:hypothetical protein
MSQQLLMYWFPLGKKIVFVAKQPDTKVFWGEKKG